MKKIIIVVLGTLFLTSDANALPSFVKERKPAKQSANTLKQKIAHKLEDGLTLLSDLIAFSARFQQTIVFQVHALIDSDGDDFFSKAKTKELDLFYQELEKDVQEIEVMQTTLEGMRERLLEKYNKTRNIKD